MLKMQRPEAVALIDMPNLAAPARSAENQTATKTTYPRLIGHWPNGDSFDVEIRSENFIIGRAPDCDLATPSAARYVSSRHAELQRTPAGFAIVDLSRMNGTRLNNQQLLAHEAVPIKHGDIIRIGSERYGSSIGFRPAQGQVLINGQDLYQHYDEFRTQMGYVPQSDILPTALTVETALTYAAELRLAADISKAERAVRITQALQTVEMDSEHLRNTRISQLSGGQRKRVSIAAELLADPKIFFLDEPASGLDPGLEKKLMYTLRKMADEGRTIIMITHATDNITQVDQVAFLAQGKLIYYGPPAAAQPYFEVDEFADIYEKIEAYGDDWRRVFGVKPCVTFGVLRIFI